MTLRQNYKILPNSVQKHILHQHFFAHNQAYNIILSNKDQFSFTQLDSKIKIILRNRDLQFNTKVVQQARVQAIADMKKLKKSNQTKGEKGSLKFKSSRKDFSFETTKEQFKILDTENPKYKTLRVFGQSIKIIWSKDLDNWSSIRFIKDNLGDYYISLVYTKNIQNLPENPEDKVFGLDLNLKSIDFGDLRTHKKISLNKISNIKSVENLDWYKKIQRKQSKRLEDLKNEKIEKLPNQYYKDKRILAKNKKKQSNHIIWNLHQITNNIINQLKIDEISLLCVEDLNIKNMTNKKNIVKSLGAGRSKSMRKNILKTSFGQILSMLEYKCAINGIHFQKVNPKYTSKTCSNCKEINYELKLQDRWFKCPNCGNELDRDHNACINIGGNRLSA